MANRPTRSSKSAARNKKQKSQAEINRIKPAGVMSLDILKKKASVVSTINVQMPDGEVYEFYHLPMTVDMSENFVSPGPDSNYVAALRDTLAELLVNKDGSPFVDDPEQLNPIPMSILNKLWVAISSSDKEEPGEG